MAKKKDIYRIKVQRSERLEETRAPDPDDEWDRGNTSTDHTVYGLEIVGKDDYYDLLVDFKPVIGETYYLLYAVYSTGDTFGYDDMSSIEFIELYEGKDLDVANKNLKLIAESTNAKNKEKFLMKIYSKKGRRTVDQALPWNGYFEHLDYARLEALSFTKVI